MPVFVLLCRSPAFVLSDLQWCDPDNHNPLFGQAHATWHVLSATSLLFLAQFYQANFWLDSTADVLPLLPRARGSKGRD